MIQEIKTTQFFVRFYLTKAVTTPIGTPLPTIVLDVPVYTSGYDYHFGLRRGAPNASDVEEVLRTEAGAAVNDVYSFNGEILSQTLVPLGTTNSIRSITFDWNEDGVGLPTISNITKTSRDVVTKANVLAIDDWYYEYVITAYAIGTLVPHPDAEILGGSRSMISWVTGSEVILVPGHDFSRTHVINDYRFRNVSVFSYQDNLDITELYVIKADLVAVTALQTPEEHALEWALIELENLQALVDAEEDGYIPPAGESTEPACVTYHYKMLVIASVIQASNNPFAASIAKSLQHVVNSDYSSASISLALRKIKETGGAAAAGNLALSSIIPGLGSVARLATETTTQTAKVIEPIKPAVLSARKPISDV